MPAYLIDRHRRVRWLNRAGVELLGERTGQLFWRLVAPEDIHTARQRFARRLLRETTEDAPITLLDRAGRRVRLQLVCVPMTDDGAVDGIFGLAIRAPGPGHRAAGQAPVGEQSELPTPRQLEVLHLLARGLETSEIASALGLAEHTVRNHMRGLFRQLGVKSRLQAVLRGHQFGLLETEDLLADRP